MSQTKIEGIDEVMKNLNREIGNIKGRTTTGLLAAGLKLQRAAQEKVPVKFGGLKRSAFTRRVPEEEHLVEIGFSAAYALFIHENMEQVLKGQPRTDGPGVYWGPNGQPKFLEQPLQEMEPELLKTVADYARIK